MIWCSTGNEMVRDGGSEPLVVPTRRALLGVALGGAPVWPCGGGEGFTEKSIGRRPTYYLPLGQREHHIKEYFKKKRGKKRKFIQTHQQKASHEERGKKMMVVV